MKVAKFGGSSLANSVQIKKVFDIVKEDIERRVIVVSAPGKRSSQDEKVTDLLIELAETQMDRQDGSTIRAKILARFQTIADELNIKAPIMQEIHHHFDQLAKRTDLRPDYLLDAYKASGEDCNARLIAAYFNENGLPAKYVNPLEAGLLLSDHPGRAYILPEAFEQLSSLATSQEVIVFPGFFGATKEGKVVTFARGGSDLTGSVLAAALQADMYENFTDVDAIYVANPAMVTNPLAIEVLSYREMRELSYAGFSVVQGEALFPAIAHNIPVHVRNTNNPQSQGTFIMKGKTTSPNVISGIASSSGFIEIYIQKILMNYEIGFMRKILTIFEEEYVSIEHIPTGIDDITIILHSDQVTDGKLDRIIDRIKLEADADQVNVNKRLCLIMLVGEGMINVVGTTARVTSALARQQINIEVFNQGASEVSMMFGIEEQHEAAAVRALYDEFFGEKRTYTVVEEKWQ